MRTIFQKFKTFWKTFWEAFSGAYNKVFREPIESLTQEWRDIKSINFLDIFVSKLNNLANTEATFEVESDSTQSEPLKLLCEDLEAKRFEITENMLAEGDYWIFPATDSKGKIVHSYLTQQQVRILSMDGTEIKELEGIIDWYVDKHNKVYYLCRHHKLDDNNTLTVSYRVVDDNNRTTILAKWADLTEQSYSFTNAINIGAGRYKSPASSRGLSSVYGVPLNFGCADIEGKIVNDLKLIESEFKNGKSVIFTDPRNLLKDDEAKEYKLAENIIPVYNKAGQNGKNIDIFNPNLRYSEHYSKLVGDLAIYEKQVGTSKGILTDNQTTETATATAVKRANADTIALLNKIHSAIDAGNLMTLKADSIFLNVSPDLWSYKSDWYDPFEDPAEQWKRLVEAKGAGAIEAADLTKWLYPNLSEEDIEKKLANISAQSKADTDSAIERMLGGA